MQLVVQVLCCAKKYILKNAIGWTQCRVTSVFRRRSVALPLCICLVLPAGDTEHTHGPHGERPVVPLLVQLVEVVLRDVSGHVLATEDTRKDSKCVKCILFL